MQIPFLMKSHELIGLLKRGSPIVFPTDTVPALAATPEHSSNLWKIKNRPQSKPLILMAASIQDLLLYALEDAAKDAFGLASAYWPGALTMVLPVNSDIAAKLNPFGESIGMRVPACNLALDFLQKSGPLATTSANLSGLDPLMNPESISESFPELPLLGPLPWPQGSGLPSTLIKWQEGDWQLLRRGAVIPSEVA